MLFLSGIPSLSSLANDADSEGMNSPKPSLSSMVHDWSKLQVIPTKVGERRDLFDGPTNTLVNFECHATTLNAGETPHSPHRHPDEEMIIVKEGTLQVTINGKSETAGAGVGVLFHVQRPAWPAQRGQRPGNLSRFPVHHGDDASRQRDRGITSRQCGRGRTSGRIVSNIWIQPFGSEQFKIRSDFTHPRLG